MGGGVIRLYPERGGKIIEGGIIWETMARADITMTGGKCPGRGTANAKALRQDWVGDLRNNGSRLGRTCPCPGHQGAAEPSRWERQ